MKTDFGYLYAAQFKNNEDLRLWKRRIWAKLKGQDIKDIYAGYELQTTRKPNHLPTIPELVQATLEAAKDRKRMESVEAQLRLPKPRRMDESIAKGNVKEIRNQLKAINLKINTSLTPEENQKRIEELREKENAHENMLKKAQASHQI